MMPLQPYRPEVPEPAPCARVDGSEVDCYLAVDVDMAHVPCSVTDCTTPVEWVICDGMIPRCDPHFYYGAPGELATLGAQAHQTAGW